MNLAVVPRTGAVLVLALTLQACATLDGEARAARSPAACARASTREVDPRALGDKRAHCLGAARMARRCSVAEATLASYAKELRDLFGPGNAEAADIRAGRAGIVCAREHSANEDLALCCEGRGF